MIKWPLNIHTYTTFDYSSVVVQDSGVGIPRDKFDVIFEPFRRLSPSYEGKYNGVGLGLYTVKTFINNCQGEIFVDSEEDKGSTFTCFIPYSLDYDAVLPDRLKHTIPDEELMPLLHGKEILKILVVEDDQICRLAETMLLKKHHHHVDMATSGQEAVKKAAETTYDLILMDVGLPDMDGCETTKRIRALGNNGQGTLIVGLTAHVFPEHKKQCVAAGMNTVLFKPFSMKNFVQLLTLYGMQPAK